MPSEMPNKPQIMDNHDGTVSIQYDPKVEGLHELQIKYNQEHVQGSPFKFHVDSISSGYVTACGPGLSLGVAGEACNFTVYTKNIGAESIGVTIDGPSRAEINTHDNKDGSVGVSYIPPAPGMYKISVKAQDTHIKGSPFTAKVTGEGRKRSQVSIAHTSEVSLKTAEKDIKNLNASICAPSGLEEPVFVKKLPDGNFAVSFTPREDGEHVINVKRMGKHINNSPFKINVLQKDIGSASKVKLSGNGMREGKTHTENEIIVDTNNAGFGGLNFSVEGRSKAEINYEDQESGVVRLTYKVTEPGYYILSLKFADHHVPGSPFTLKVSGSGSNVQREIVKKHIEGIPIRDIGKECRMTFKLPGSNAFDMSAQVTFPGGDHDDAEIIDLDDCHYQLRFTARELGVHTVSVRCKDIHIPGSPFQYTIGPIHDHGAHRVQAGGPGLDRGIAKEFCEFNIWTHETGAGVLSVSVEGPSKAEIDIKDNKDASVYAKYRVSESGDYRIGVRFNDEPIPDSPFIVYMMPDDGEARRIEIGRVPDSGLQVNKPVALTVIMNGAKELLDGKVVSPSGSEDDCFVAPVDEDQWAVRFIPRENGIHNLLIRYNGIHIPQSPFRILIGQDDADPAAVHASGSGLKDIVCGNKTDFIVDTCNAGAGNLAVTIDGPSTVSMDCTEVAEGYKVRYTPLAPGDYFITIKYNGYHIVGSPFKLACTGCPIAEAGTVETSSVAVETVAKTVKQKSDGIPRFRSDANKVVCKGTGIKKALLCKQSTFNVNASDAGNNLLFVAIYGPKGPCEEVHLKHAGRNVYQVAYLAKERGEHIMLIKYGDDQIPGSPFKVECS